MVEVVLLVAAGGEAVAAVATIAVVEKRARALPAFGLRCEGAGRAEALRVVVVVSRRCAGAMSVLGRRRRRVSMRL